MRRIRNPVTGRSYPVRQRKTSAATIENIKTLIDNDTKRIATSLLLTGMRYAEIQRFRLNPDWCSIIRISPCKSL